MIVIISMKYILLTFDVEEFDFPLEINQKIKEEDMFEISKKGLDSLLKLLNHHKIKATFFTTSLFARKYPEKIRIISENNEIASHGYSHSHPISIEILKKAKKEKELIINKEIKGFRAPRWDIKNMRIVEKAGFIYDSSTHPIYLPGRYFNLSQKRKIHKINNIVEIPMSTLNPNFSIFWLAFKNFPLVYSKLFTRINFITSDYTMLVFHPWEFSDLSGINLPSHIKKISGKNMLNKLEDFILFCKIRKYQFFTIYDFLKQYL